ncbi:MAG: cysteine hydrolase [Xanthobacteraceae bacterium]|jgi:nicotinamidase-related amidase
MKREKWLLAFGFAAAISLGTSTLHAASIIDEWANVKAPAAPPPLKTVTVDPKTTALLMLDFVNPICGHTPRCVATLPAVKKLLDEARKSGTMVVYTGIPQVPMTEVVADLAPTGSEPYVQSFIDKFLNSDLEKILKDKGIKTVIAVGVSAVGAVMNTASHAAQIGFEVIVPADGLSAPDLYFEQYAVWQLTHAPVIPPHITLTSIDMMKF